MDKSIASLSDAVAEIDDGAVLMIGGFGGSGAPIELIHALIDRFKATGHPKGLTVVNNNAGNGKIGIAAMIDAGPGMRAQLRFNTLNLAEALCYMCHI